MPQIDTWLAEGRRIVDGKPLATSQWGTPNSTGCGCNNILESAAQAPDREAWFQLCPQCRSGYDMVAGLPYSPSLGGFTGSGVTAPDAAVIVPVTPPPATPPTPPSGPMIYPGQPIPVSTAGEPTAMPFISTTPQPAPTGGSSGGWIDGIVNWATGQFGQSRCPGPYNYDPATGGCVPKPGSLVGGQNVPTSTGTGSGTQLPSTPGVTTPAEWSTTGWQAVTDDFGYPAVAPRVVGARMRNDGSSVPILGCPPGAVLGKNNLCYRGAPPGGRKWKKPPRPVLSSSDMKVVRKMSTIQKRVRKAASVSGFTCKKR